MSTNPVSSTPQSKLVETLNGLSRNLPSPCTTVHSRGPSVILMFRHRDSAHLFFRSYIVPLPTVSPPP